MNSFSLLGKSRALIGRSVLEVVRSPARAFLPAAHFDPRRAIPTRATSPPLDYCHFYSTSYLLLRLEIPENVMCFDSRICEDRTKVGCSLILICAALSCTCTFSVQSSTITSANKSYNFSELFRVFILEELHRSRTSRQRYDPNKRQFNEHLFHNLRIKKKR